MYNNNYTQPSTQNELNITLDEQFYDELADLLFCECDNTEFEKINRGIEIGLEHIQNQLQQLSYNVQTAEDATNFLTNINSIKQEKK